MTLLALIVLFSLIGGLLSVTAAAVYLLLPESTRERAMPHLVSFATGALLSAALVGLLPEAMNNKMGVSAQAITSTVLAGLLLFFVLEKLVIWRHAHHDDHELHPDELHVHSQRAAGMLIIIGDAIHNFVDGILIGAAFLTDTHLGIVTALAVAAHEIPQELGDFAILLHSGYSRGKAFFYNLLSSVTTVFGGLLVWLGLSQSSPALPYLTAIAAASFLYIAVADLIPGMHKKTGFRDSALQLTLICLGILAIVLAEFLLLG
jgi:zinc and cadmium transporter